MKTKYCLSALALALGLLLAGCQATASGAASSPSASGASSSAAPASSGMAASSNAASSADPLVITEKFTHPSTVASIENLGDYIRDFEYKDVKANNINTAWETLLGRATITGYPKGMLEYTEYSLYQNYLDMAKYYGTDIDTMLKEQMNLSHDEMVAEIQHEAKYYMDMGLVARYILEKENLVSPEALAEANQYILNMVEGHNTENIVAPATEDTAASSTTSPAPTALNITTEQALALAGAWMQDNLLN